MGDCTTRYWQTSGQLVQKLDVCTKGMIQFRAATNVMELSVLLFDLACSTVQRVVCCYRDVVGFGSDLLYIHSCTQATSDSIASADRKRARDVG